ncbi:Fic family protein [Candidatus Woesearchaeota archaeon]|nr:Fic family protein [Candidatus Woesearchaeota archaeon]
MNLTKKDIIGINQKFASGEFQNESNLDFALQYIKQSIPWTKQLAYIIRSVLVGHSFADGNKRTAFMVLTTTVDMNSCIIDDKQAINMVKNWVLKNEESITNIQRRIEDAITKK